MTADELPTDDTCIFIPTLNEAATIGGVVAGFREQGFSNILVYDGGSTDGTADIAREQGARVAQGPGNGKGAAVREAINREIDARYIVMLDGDGTYHPAEVDRLLSPLLDGYDHVIGDRFANMEPGAMSRFHRVGNRAFNTLFKTLYYTDYRDILSGYRAFTKESVDQLSLTEDGFGIETELAAKCARNELRTTVVPITYSPRPTDSNAELNPIRDGGVILGALLRHRRM